MVWYVVTVLASLIFDVYRLAMMPLDDKDLEILLLRQQLMIVQRKQNRGPYISRFEKVMLLTLMTRLSDVKRSTRAVIERHILLFKPDTILRWHRALVSKKWTFTNNAAQGGRPPLAAEVEALIVQLARENDWGAGKIQGEQQARQCVWKLQDEERQINYLIHDRDGKFCNALDPVFESSGIEIIKTPVRAPNANAYAERWVRSIREECLDRIVILNHRHLRHVLSEYERYYNEARPHQGIDQNIPVAAKPEIKVGQVRCRKRL